MKGAIVTLVDRKSRFLRMGLVEHRTKEAVKNTIIKLLKEFPVHTITCDNGIEFLAHEEISEVLEAETFLLIPMLRGREEPMKIPMVSFANISQRKLTLKTYPKMTFVI